ncbi:G-protein associated signal transduction protein, putative [Hepatocystis sp. ex Piliocolobus tephrosceles]|nr:G-protein associated signal transduction protein, putative [Hepatocystis sp. ex Piliocolobus tephrosceles]
MKFAEKLKHLKIKSWDNKYINYKFLKKIIKHKYNDEIGSLYEKIDKNDAEILEVCHLVTHNSVVTNAHPREKKKINETDAEDINYTYLFFYVLRNHINIVKQHYEQEYNNLNEKINEIKCFLANNNKINLKSIDELKTKCLNVYNLFDVLNNYLNINVLSVYKILKKKNKKANLSTSLDLYQKYCNDLHRISREERFNEKIKATYLSIQKKKEDNKEKIDFINFKSYIKNKIESLEQYKKPLYFFFGVLIVLVINTLILLYININKININVIMSILPIYRLIYILNFLFLFLFGSFLFMQLYGVNFTIIYVVLLCVILFCTFIVPINFYKYNEKNHVFPSFIRVLMSGLFLVNNVTLLDNIVGDMLTSLSKTFTDIQYFICFIVNGLNTNEPAKCPIMEKYINPIALGLPFYLRICQCLIRYNSEGGKIHLYNMLKYVCGIIIVICSSFNWDYWGIDAYTSNIIIICAYLVGSLYMYFWDLYCDWGLLNEYNSFLRKNNNILYPPHYYYLAGFLNLIFRLTWAITILPINLLQNKEMNTFLIVLFLMFIEVLRRSIWICFRLENEHATNASRYRTILWVPKMTKAKKF